MDDTLHFLVLVLGLEGEFRERSGILFVKYCFESQVRSLDHLDGKSGVHGPLLFPKARYVARSTQLGPPLLFRAYLG